MKKYIILTITTLLIPLGTFAGEMETDHTIKVEHTGNNGDIAQETKDAANLACIDFGFKKAKSYYVKLGKPHTVSKIVCH